jgi:putative peptidoglycan lipid II flippase
LQDTRTPLRFAIVRVVLTTILGYLSALPLPRLLGIEPRWGVAGLTISAGIASWVEFTLLQRGLRSRLGQVGVQLKFLAQVWSASVLGAALGRGVFTAIGHRKPIPAAILVLGTYAVVFFGLAMAMKLPEARSMLGILRRRVDVK